VPTTGWRGRTLTYTTGGIVAAWRSNEGEGWNATARPGERGHCCNCIGCCKKCGTCRTAPWHNLRYCALVVRQVRERQGLARSQAGGPA